MKKHVVGIGLILFTFIASQAMARDLADRLYPVDLLKEALDEFNCYKSETTFITCGFALNELFLITQKTYALPESYDWSAEKKFQTITVESTNVKNGVQFTKAKVEQIAERMKDPAILQLPTEIYENSSAAWRTLHQNTKKAHLPFKEWVADTIAGLSAFKALKIATPERDKAQEESAKTSVAVLSKYISILKQDPHARFVTTEDLFAGAKDTGNEYTGVGMTLNPGSTGAEVVGVIDGTSAEEKAIQAGDIVTHVGSDSWQDLGQNLQTFVERIRGNAGTTIDIKILRDGKKLDFTLERKTVKIEYVKVKSIQYQGAKYGLIRLENFTSSSGCLRARDAVHALVKAEGFPRGWILDLRGNPGGLVFQARCIAGMFLNQSQSVYYFEPTDESKEGKTFFPLITTGQILGQMFSGDPAMQASIERDTKPTEVDAILPLRQSLVVLVDEGSASASELLSGALRDHKRALIVGEKTYGKGCGQDVPKEEDRLFTKFGLTLFTTSFYYLKPNGGSVQHHGIKPDIVVPKNVKAQENARPVSREKHLAPGSLSALELGETPKIRRLKKIRDCATDFDWSKSKDLQREVALRVFGCGW